MPEGTRSSLALLGLQATALGKGAKCPKTEQAPGNAYLIIHCEDQVIPGPKPRSGNRSFILTLRSAGMPIPTSVREQRPAP